MLARYGFTVMSEKQDHIDRNYEAFKRLLPDLLATHAGKTALLRNEELVDIFDSMADAERAGRRLYPDGLFSVQRITDRTVDLGYFSHAEHFG
jgi:hypothetical protein